MSTLHMDIPRPSMTVPISSKPIPDKERNVIPIINSNNDPKRTIGVLKRRANLGAIGDRRANDSNGSVVINPANVLEMAKSSRIVPISGPTEVSGARIFIAIKIIPATSSQPFEDV